MPLICVDGIDQVGKSTVVKNLQDHLSGFYKVASMAFPQNRNILKVDYYRTDIDSIMGYHKMFLKDFKDNQTKLRDLLENNDLVILDRYIGSYITYLTYDVFYYKAIIAKMNQFDLIDYLEKISEEKAKELNGLIKPDFTLLIYNYSPTLDRLDGMKQEMYSTCLTMLEQPYEKIEALKRDTMTQVLETLKQKKYITDMEVNQT